MKEVIMIKNKKKLKVYHIPQLGHNQSFEVEVKDEYEANLLINTLAAQHLWLYNNKYIPDYSNILGVLQWNEEEKDWEDYYDEETGLNFEEYVEEFII
jgi:hypothetical protein